MDPDQLCSHIWYTPLALYASSKVKQSMSKQNAECDITNEDYTFDYEVNDNSVKELKIYLEELIYEMKHVIST